MKLLRCAIHRALAGTDGFFFCRLISQWLLKPDKGWFRSFAIGRIGKIYEKLNIHKWQAKVPDMSRVFPKPKYCSADL